MEGPECPESIQVCPETSDEGPDEYFSDEEGEDPYYPETERVHTTTTRSGRKVFTPQRLVVDPYIDDGSDEEMSVQGGSEADPEESEGDYEEEEEEEEEEDEDSLSAAATSISSDPDDDDDDQ